MKIIDCEQGSPEWHQARCGIPTASSFDKIVTSTGSLSKQREKYMYQLAGERVTGKPEETYKNGFMERGKEMEAEARAFYELTNGVKVNQVGFCLENGYGASPDGLVGDDGVLEIKCPLLSTHVSYLLKGTMPTEYFQQVQGQLLLTGRKWVDFISYYASMKPMVIRIVPDIKFQRILKVELEVFCGQLDDIVSKIK